MDKEDLRRCLEIIRASRRRRREQQPVTKRPTTEGGPPTLTDRRRPTQERSGDGSDGTHVAGGGHTYASGSSDSDSEASDCIILSQTLNTTWPYMDPKKQNSYSKGENRRGQEEVLHGRREG